MMDMMREIIGSLCEMGFEKILILNGHGHHTELLRVVAREIADELRCKTKSVDNALARIKRKVACVALGDADLTALRF